MIPRSMVPLMGDGFGPAAGPFKLMAPSSSGLGRRPLKAEVAGSNPVGATKFSRLRVFSAFFCFQAIPYAAYGDALGIWGSCEFGRCWRLSDCQKVATVW